MNDAEMKSYVAAAVAEGILHRGGNLQAVADNARVAQQFGHFFRAIPNRR